MKTSKLIVPIFLTWIGLLKAVSGQENLSAPTTVQLTLQKAEELALSGNPLIHAADDRAWAASHKGPQDLLPADPTFMIDRTTPGMEMWMIDEDLGIPGTGIAKADVDGAETHRMQAEAWNTRRSILLQARQAFWDFYYRRKLDEVLQEAGKNWKALDQALQSRELTGQWLSMKTIRMQMETAKGANELITNGRALAISQQNMDHLFSLPHATVYSFSEEPSLSPFSGHEGDYLRKAMESNPEITAYRWALQAREAEKHLSSLELLPDLSVRVTGLRDPSGNGFSDYGFRIGLTIPIFMPFKQIEGLDQAGDEWSASRYDLKGKEDETIHMVEDAYVNAESTWRILQLYQGGGLLKQTQRAWIATQTAYRNEEMSLPEFVENFNTYVETVKNYYEAQADYGKALAQLDYEVGTVPVPPSKQGVKP